MEMNWHQALQESLSWLAIASFITLVCFIAAATLAVRCTRWGSQFWQLAGPYFSFRRSWRPLLVFALLLLTALSGLLLVLLWDSYRLAGIIGLCVFYGIAALYCGLRLKAAVFDESSPFGATLEELAKDRERLLP